MKRKRQADNTVAKEIRTLDDLDREIYDSDAAYDDMQSIAFVCARVEAARGALRWQQNESSIFGPPSKLLRCLAFGKADVTREPRFRKIDDA